MTTQVAAPPDTKTETFFERQAWKILLGVIVLIGFFGIGDMLGGASDLQKGETVLMHSLTGTSWNDLRVDSPKAADLIEWKFRTDGASLFTIALLSGLVIWTGFRRGARWSWVALWALPVWLVLTILITFNAIKYPGYGTPVPILSGSILLTLWVLSLALTYRKFFHEFQE
ncbi:MAG: hypothetical protein M1281_17440 [Chloroflexi bacterium]|nr:hypothetical protein [Chloroflexota bacterium]